nr:PREDICTED: ER lumen protein-retaining receptor 3 [Bos mutus]
MTIAVGHPFLGGFQPAKPMPSSGTRDPTSPQNGSSELCVQMREPRQKEGPSGSPTVTLRSKQGRQGPGLRGDPSQGYRRGISGKSQILFALVFTTRYLDLFTNFISIYNTVMKMVFLLCAYVTVYMIYGKFRKTFDSENDTFRLEFLLVPVIGLSFLENYSFTPLEILWTFSIYLESVAILPQLFMISKTGEAETITTHYLFFLGLYRALYLANWIRRYQTENFYDQIAVVSGVVQTIFYCDFFYLYVTKVLKGKKLSLPMPI